MILATVLVAALAGALVGSFLNVVVHRVPLGISVVSPPSRCPSCETPIRARHNVPVLGWLLLRGRCYDCHAPISARYPLVEALGAVAFALVAWRFAPLAWEAPTGRLAIAGALVLVAFVYLAAISIALALIDLDTHTLPNAIVLPAYAVGLLLLGAAALLAEDPWLVLRALIGAAALFLVYFLMAIAYPGGMGFGDVKLAGVLGLFLGFLGWGQLVVGAFAAFLLGGLFSLALLALRRADRRTRIPFGPWMILGAWLGVAVGPVVWDAYLGWFGL